MTKRPDRYLEEFDGSKIIHAGSAEGGDYTLCGAAMDGETGSENMTEVTRGKISCHSCLRIIAYCKAIPAALTTRQQGGTDD